MRIREPNWHEHRLFEGPDTNVNLHVFSAGCPEIERMVISCTHDDDRLLYEQTKRTLAQRTWKYTQHYADAKTTVIDEILSRAAGARPDVKRHS